MKSLLSVLMIISFVSVLILTGCTISTNTIECVSENSIMNISAAGGTEPNPTTESENILVEAERTHATLLVHDIALEYPIDWRYWRNENSVMVFPKGRNPRNFIYERTAFEIYWWPITEYTEPNASVLLHHPGTFETIVGNTTAISWPMLYANLRGLPSSQIVRYRVTWYNHVFDIHLQSGDGCEAEWAVLETIRDSLQFHGDGANAFDWTIYDEARVIRESAWQEFINAVEYDTKIINGIYHMRDISIWFPDHWTTEKAFRAQGYAIVFFNPETNRNLAYFTKAEVIVEWDLGELPTIQELLYRNDGDIEHRIITIDGVEAVQVKSQIICPLVADSMDITDTTNTGRIHELIFIPHNGNLYTIQFIYSATWQREHDIFSAMRDSITFHK